MQSSDKPLSGPRFGAPQASTSMFALLWRNVLFFHRHHIYINIYIYIYTSYYIYDNDTHNDRSNSRTTSSIDSTRAHLQRKGCCVRPLAAVSSERSLGAAQLDPIASNYV